VRLQIIIEVVSIHKIGFKSLLQASESSKSGASTLPTNEIECLQLQTTFNIIVDKDWGSSDENSRWYLPHAIPTLILSFSNHPMVLFFFIYLCCGDIARKRWNLLDCNDIAETSPSAAAAKLAAVGWKQTPEVCADCLPAGSTTCDQVCIY
jgi:hypothetical protein